VLARDADHNDGGVFRASRVGYIGRERRSRSQAAVDGRYVNTRRKGIYLLPNLVTTGGLFAGFYSIVASIDGNFSAAAWAIFAAMLLDGLDGRVARLTSTASEFGKEFDSLADMVSFGLAPAIVVYQWAVELLEQRVVDGLAANMGILGRFVWLATFLYVAAAAFRLARFNSNVAQDRRFFQGLASPAAAAGVASMIWVATAQGFDSLAVIVAGVTITAVTGLLMMSRFAYVSFKDVSPGRRVRFAQLVLIPLVLIVIAIEPSVTIFGLFVVYAASGPAAWAWHRRHRRHDAVAP
jgi:CDP-diacylglycerol--serine O-phosphatidyltransferase